MNGPTTEDVFARGPFDHGDSPEVATLMGPAPDWATPVKGGMMDGLDALLATVRMPAGVPVATVAVGSHGARNAAILALQMLALGSEAHAATLARMRAEQTGAVPMYPEG